ncbi:Nicotinate catabolism cluster-specific transcription factor [Hyphodiscus hymeniophilus]|uniref:Nicotinate catabolism cluster-specific transcription factor n=1 Tax=Hyphodiscus hymeniophilus TaxID=353542 RepID=A0A9P6VJZ8_9HELO|nr:Nicotinate catabolism cluster-specific transcription factor [Hyphodiscus hymeniophilus]
MDSSYSSYGMNSNNSLPGVSPHQLQHNTTLPPLQPNATMQNNNNYGSNPHTPRTPNTPGSGNMMGSYPQNQMPQQPRYNMMPANNYQQQQQVRYSSSMIPQSSTAMTQPQSIAPAPSNGKMPQPLRPMPPNGMHMQPSMASPYGQNNMMSQPPMMMEEQPTHVVGSQGRRGILPSAPGRPAVGATTAAKGSVIPQKDADGKFPCPHCTKTYLHAKHLKRHLLRHTGDRPYMCVLCRDTFSRSDILKRHFQKCSIRRGNPTGASHLSHAQAHLKKSHPGPHKNTPSMSNEEMMGSNGMGMNDPALHPFGVIPDGSIPDAGSNMTDDQAAQANNMKRLSRDGGSMTGLGPGGSNPAAYGQGYAGIASSLPSGMNPSLAFSVPNGQNGHSYNNQGYDFISSAAGMPHPPTARNSLSVYAGNNARQQPGVWSQVNIKTETNSGLYPSYSGPSRETGPTSEHPKWNNQNDYYQEISQRLIFFCFPQNNQITSRSNEMRIFLSASNVQHFLEQFSNFQVHFPIIHMPTFRIAEAYDGLLLAMICVGAVYSNRLAATQVREMMEFAKVVVESNSQVYATVLRDQTGSNGFEPGTFGSTTLETEQITALLLMQVLFTWHGTPIQREKARQQNPLIIGLARKAGLTMPKTTLPFSALHQPNMVVEHFNVASFDWDSWVEQEKRSRLMFTIFLLDAAMVIYFNTAPVLDTFEIRVPLPADDAAWGARTGNECAEALGLHGPAIARDRNPSGSRRAKQPEMHSALTALMHNVYDLQPGTTNLYSKFVLIHALHIQLWTAQRQQSQESSQLIGQALGFPNSASSTPLSQNDWVARGVDPITAGGSSANNSGRATPVSTGAQSPMLNPLLKVTSHAFEKWKKAWDDDMAIQYPPTSTPSRRFGFCRDAAHFYWLAKLLMKTNLDWQMAPDQRFGNIISMLKQVRAYVVSDSARRGEELGSVNDIDSGYGVKDLTLDMAQLFTPINSQSNSPIGGVHMKFENMA